MPGSFKRNFLTFGVTDIWIGQAKRIMDLKQTAFTSLPDALYGCEVEEPLDINPKQPKQLRFPLPEPTYEV